MGPLQVLRGHEDRLVASALAGQDGDVLVFVHLERVQRVNAANRVCRRLGRCLD
jgi:hypothetical protein